MIPSAGFWDSSALTPLFLRETNSAQARVLARRHAPVVWWGTVVEIRSAIAREHRSSLLGDSERGTLILLLGKARGGWLEILPSDVLRELAADLLDQHALRAADSLQLAAALVWCREKPAGRQFICQDVRLCDAASQAGFTVIQL